MTARSLVRNSRMSTNTAARYLRDMAISKDNATLESNAKRVDELIVSIRSDIEELKAMNILDAGEVNTYSTLKSRGKPES